MAAYKTLNDIGDIHGVSVLLRLDFNVPIRDGKVVDDYRIRKSLPTINTLREKGAKVIIISHIEGESDSLKPVYNHLKDILPISFCEDCVENGGECVSVLNPGDVLLCENIRLYDGEKKNDENFTKKLSALATIYVNDAFSVSHRKHASIVGVPKFLPGYIGLQFEEEIKKLSTAFNPEHPFLFILGGAKFDTKLPLVEKFLALADTVFIGGALANDFYKAQGLNVGVSLISEGADITHFVGNSKILLPTDVVIGTKAIKKPDEITDEEKILDAGPGTLQVLKDIISQAKFILWNGPLGNYENGFTGPTLELAKIISESSAYSVVGGGDTLAAIASLGIEDKFGFISTAGGAMLDFLAHETVPGLEALKNSKSK